MREKTHPHRGSTLDSLLEEEGVKEAFEAQAIKEVIAWQLMQGMEERTKWVADAPRDTAAVSWCHED